MAYLPIEDQGVIGKMRTVTLVGIDGGIDWFCCPNFDSTSVFGAILDDVKGGRFSIHPVHEATAHKQFYWPETNVLVPRFLSDEGVGEVIDFMPVAAPNGDNRPQIIRRVNVVRGRIHWKVECGPAFDYARDSHEVIVDRRGARFVSSELALQLCTAVPLTHTGKGVEVEFVLEEGETATFAVVNISSPEDHGMTPSESLGEDMFSSTVEYWRKWQSQCTYMGRWREMVERSALVLKLLTFELTGAVVAAPTTNLPEHLGGFRNWDYRYTWIRDAAFTLYGLLRIGFTEAAEGFMAWMEARARETGPQGPLQIMYGLDGRHELTEITLDHLDDYRGSKPVCVGNGAYDQLRLDIYGELLDAVYLFNKYGEPISYEFWTHLRDMTNWVCDNWDRIDEGIWETCGGQKHFVYSKVMCWVAVDRALRLADTRSFSAIDRGGWKSETASTRRSKRRAGTPSSTRSCNHTAPTPSMPRV